MASFVPTPGQYYYIVAKHSSKVLHVNTGDITVTAPVTTTNVLQVTKKDTDNQQWKFEEAGGGYYYVVSKQNGKVLDVASASTEKNIDVYHWTKGSGANQQWKIEDAGDGYFYLVAKHSGLVLNVSGGGTTDGLKLIQWPKGADNNSKWKFEVVTPPSLPPISDNGTIKTEAGKTYKVQITVDVAASNSYNNSFGIFAINDDGSVAGVKPGDPNYAQTVVKNRVPITAADEGSYKKGQTFQYELPGGPTYSVFLIANGTPALFLEKNPQNQGSNPPLAYFFNTAANPDGKSHIKKISSNQYGFEDIYGGGDQDFDDVIVKIEDLAV